MNKDINNDSNSLIGMDISELESIVKNIGESKYRAGQIFNWIYKQRAEAFNELVNLPKTLIAELSNKYTISPLKIIRITGEETDPTRKYLLECQDGEQIEAVLIKDSKRMTICISSQVGCALGCQFCATGTMGIKRNLNSGEIVAQYILLANNSPELITNVVFMGMGEPFLNYDNVIKSADLLNSADGINLGARRITISTAGIVPQIKQFADEKQRFKLAISLNGTTQAQRLQTMPIAKKYPLEELVESAKYYFDRTRNLLTFEYVLLNGVNDSYEDAERLSRLLYNVPCKLNVIPYNEIGGIFSRPNDTKINRFLNHLSDANFTVTTRWSKGADISAGCGQLVVNK